MQDEELELEQHRLHSRLVAMVGLYLLIGVLPVFLLGSGSVAKAVADETLPAGQRLVPAATWGTVAAASGVLLSLVSAPFITLVGVYRSTPRRDVFWIFTLMLFSVHSMVVCGGLSTSLVGAAPLLFGDHFVDKTSSPNGKELAYLYKRRASYSCGWEVYVGDKMDPVSSHLATTTCSCESPPRAELRWSGVDPHLEDRQGNPYTCPSPSCSSVGSGQVGGMLLWVLAAALVRRRRCGRRRPL